jgi:hypothetical protein
MRLYTFSLLFALVTALLIPISASAQTDAECVAFYDADGTRVARAGVGSSSPSNDLNEAVIFLAHGGLVALLDVTKNRLVGNGGVWFTGAGCTGDAYMLAGATQPMAYLNGNDVWYPDTSAPTVSVTSQSERRADGSCAATTVVVNPAAPAFNFAIPTFTPPFHLEPEACFTPGGPDPEQIINACVKNKGGAMRMVDDPAECTARETPITLLSP